MEETSRRTLLYFADFLHSNEIKLVSLASVCTGDYAIFGWRRLSLPCPFIGIELIVRAVSVPSAFMGIYSHDRKPSGGLRMAADVSKVPGFFSSDFTTSPLCYFPKRFRRHERLFVTCLKGLHDMCQTLSKFARGSLYTY